MKLGLIARADQSGLAIQTHAFHRWMQPERTLVIDVGHLHNDGDHCNKSTDLGKYPGALVHQGWTPHSGCLEEFLTGLDAVFTAETTYSSELIPMAEVYRVKVVIAPNWEFLDVRHKPALWAAPTLWNYDLMPDPKMHLPVPIETDRFTPRPLPDVAQHFLHVAGRPAHLDRNGTEILLRALPHIKSKVTVTVRCQQAGYVSGLVPDLHTPNNVTFIVDSAPVDDHADLYSTGDMLISPRRYGGLHLPALEALGVGMPVIMPNVSPNNTWLPKDWLVPATQQGSFRAKQQVDYYTVDPRDLAAQIDRYATSPLAFKEAKADALRLRNELSWDVWKSRYEEVLGNA